MLMRLGRRSNRWQLTSGQLRERALDRLGLRMTVPPGHRDRRVPRDLREREGSQGIQFGSNLAAKPAVSPAFLPHLPRCAAYVVNGIGEEPPIPKPSIPVSRSNVPGTLNFVG